MKEDLKVNPLIGKLLKDLRQNKLKMTQRRFAEVIGTQQSTVYRWENGQTTPMLTLAQIKALLAQMQEHGLDPIADFPCPNATPNQFNKVVL